LHAVLYLISCDFLFTKESQGVGRRMTYGSTRTEIWDDTLVLENEAVRLEISKETLKIYAFSVKEQSYCLLLDSQILGELVLLDDSSQLRLIGARISEIIYDREQEETSIVLMILTDHRDLNLNLKMCLKSDSKVVHIVLKGKVADSILVHRLMTKFTFRPCGSDVHPDYHYVPYLRPSEDAVIADHVFNSPGIVFQHDHFRAMIVPDLDLINELNKSRRIHTALNAGVLGAKYESSWCSFGICGWSTFFPEETDDFPMCVNFYRHTDEDTQEFSDEEFSYGVFISVDADAYSDNMYAPLARFLWHRHGTELVNKPEPQTVPFEQYSLYSYSSMIEHEWIDLVINNRQCGGIIRYVVPDEIFQQSWFSNIRTAYGLYWYGKRLGVDDWCEKSCRVKEFVLNMPVVNGFFPTSYNFESGKWLPDLMPHRAEEHRFYEDVDWMRSGKHLYSVGDNSWTALWLLRWHRDSEKDERILEFCATYADAVIKVQLPSGAIPSWVEAGTNNPCELLKEAAQGCAAGLFLIELYEELPRESYLESAKRLADFVIPNIVMTEKYWDFETFLSCALKRIGFRDDYTDTECQNGISLQWTAEFLLRLSQLTNDRYYLTAGRKALDLLCLYQQPWNPVFLDVYAFGGCRAQNTDAEWNDSRQAVFSATFALGYDIFGLPEYFERAIAAARASFVLLTMPENEIVSPKTAVGMCANHPKLPIGFASENFGHASKNEACGRSGFDWGAGGALSGAAYLQNQYGDIYVDIPRLSAFGINGCRAGVVGIRRNSCMVEIEDTLGVLRQLDMVIVVPSRSKGVKIEGKTFEKIKDKIWCSLQLKGKQRRSVAIEIC
jgi:hypothetical protein